MEESKQNKLLDAYNEAKKDFEKLNIVNSLEQKLLVSNDTKKLLEDQECFLRVAKEHTKVCPTCKRPLWENK